YIDSTGLGALVALNRELKEKKGKMVVTAVPPSLLKVFEITKLTDILTIKDTDDDGFAYLD
ncbi:MAG: anti-sigma factor antagonist, partial [Candidatus Hydrogenedentota bacterium]